MDLTVLGSAGFVPHEDRETCCALVRDGGAGLLLDAGSGVRRLLEQPELLDGLQRLDVLLTHFHLDHTVGLSYLPILGLPAPARIYGPGAALYGRPTAGILAQTFSRPQSGVLLDEIGEPAEAGPPGVEIGAFRVALRRQDRHRDPTLGVRLDELLALCTDTAPDPGTVEFVRGVGVLLHEVWRPSWERIDEGSHSDAASVGRIAAEAGVGRLLMIHRNPTVADYQPLVEEARAQFAASELAADGQRVTL